MVVAQGLGDADRQASRDEKGDRGAGASVGRDHAPYSSPSSAPQHSRGRSRRKRSNRQRWRVSAILLPPVSPNLIEALQAGLRDFGYVEGQNLAIEYRFALGQTKSYDELAQELIRLDPLPSSSLVPRQRSR
jgi:hypothetical protein